MTAKETALLEKMRDELHAYHVTVQEVVVRCNERCEAFTRSVSEIKLDLDGERPVNLQAPGLKAEVADLKRSRRLAVIGLRCVWAVLTILLGAAMTALVQAAR